MKVDHHVGSHLLSIAKDLFDVGQKGNLLDHVRSGDVEYIKTVDKKVLLQARDEDRNNVLLIATKNGNLNLCKEILNKCPSLLYHGNNHKRTVLHLATELSSSHEKILLIDFFISAGLEDTESEGGPINMIRFKKWMDMQSSVGDTALILAVINRSHDIVKRFAEVDRQYKLGLLKIVGSNKKTALQWATHIEDQEMIKSLTYDTGESTCWVEQALQLGRIQLGKSAMAMANILCQTDEKYSQRPVANVNNIFTLAEVSKHNNLKDCWLVINYKVYNVTTFLGDHPGGREFLLKASGKDATTDFEKAHSQNSNALTMMDKFYIGMCDSIIASSLNNLASEKPQSYSRMQLKEFTEDFSQPLGSGGFGDVYKGRFPDGMFIAVKVLKNHKFNEKVMDEQFVAEIATMGRAYHRNLIKLYGYCYEPNMNFKALVYDYVENGSFDAILFEKKLDIPYANLHNIAKKIAHGISYLHESCKPQIIHQDIKPANILLDSNLSPKVIDFGLAMVNTGESKFEQTKIKGSRDYMAPEVNQPEQVKLNCKVDVYSFGKVLFDILGSKRNHVDKSRFPGQVWEKYKTHQLDKFILECGIKEEDKENAKRLAIIALLCVEHNPRARPIMSNVVKMLEGNIKSLDTPIAPFYPGYNSSESSSMSDSRDDYALRAQPMNGIITYIRKVKGLNGKTIGHKMVATAEVIKVFGPTTGLEINKDSSLWNVSVQMAQSCCRQASVWSCMFVLLMVVVLYMY